MQTKNKEAQMKGAEVVGKRRMKHGGNQKTAPCDQSFSCGNSPGGDG